MIEIKQAKTGEIVIIPLVNDILPLLEKYEYNLPKISNQKFNDYLFEVCKKCAVLKKEITINETIGGKMITSTKPKYDLISSHTARRSFATNEFNAKDLSISEIMAITGHKTEKAFYRYIRATPKEIAERIKKTWAIRDFNRSTNVNHLKVV
jgi:integrase